jgi:hypothetical protein
MASKNGATARKLNPKRKMKTSIGNGKNSTYNKARHKKQGKKQYRGQGK